MTEITLEPGDTSGFYKLDPDSDPAALFYAPNFVYAPTYALLREHATAYDYPVDGWHWFDSAVDAYAGFNIPLPVESVVE